MDSTIVASGIVGVSAVQGTEELPLPLDYKLILQALIAILTVVNQYLIVRREKKKQNNQTNSH